MYEFTIKTHYNKHPIVKKKYESSVMTPKGEVKFHIFSKAKINNKKNLTVL